MAQVTLGFTAEHPSRDELQVSLTSPTGTTVTVLDPQGVGAEAANYDVLLADSHATGLASSQGSHDPTTPYFDQALRPYAPLVAFQDETSAGDWTLTVCDNTAGNEGSVPAQPADADPAAT